MAIAIDRVQADLRYQDILIRQNQLRKQKMGRGTTLTQGQRMDQSGVRGLSPISLARPSSSSGSESKFYLNQPEGLQIEEFEFQQNPYVRPIQNVISWENIQQQAEMDRSLLLQPTMPQDYVYSSFEGSAFAPATYTPAQYDPTTGNYTPATYEAGRYSGRDFINADPYITNPFQSREQYEETVLGGKPTFIAATFSRDDYDMQEYGGRTAFIRDNFVDTRNPFSTTPLFGELDRFERDEFSTDRRYDPSNRDLYGNLLRPEDYNVQQYGGRRNPYVDRPSDLDQSVIDARDRFGNLLDIRNNPYTDRPEDYERNPYVSSGTRPEDYERNLYVSGGTRPEDFIEEQYDASNRVFDDTDPYDMQDYDPSTYTGDVYKAKEEFNRELFTRADTEFQGFEGRNDYIRQTFGGEIPTLAQVFMDRPEFTAAEYVDAVAFDETDIYQNLEHTAPLFVQSFYDYASSVSGRMDSANQTYANYLKLHNRQNMTVDEFEHYLENDINKGYQSGNFYRRGKSFVSKYRSYYNQMESTNQIIQDTYDLAFAQHNTEEEQKYQTFLANEEQREETYEQDLAEFNRLNLEATTKYETDLAKYQEDLSQFTAAEDLAEAQNLEKLIEDHNRIEQERVDAYDAETERLRQEHTAAQDLAEADFFEREQELEDESDQAQLQARLDFEAKELETFEREEAEAQAEFDAETERLRQQFNEAQTFARSTREQEQTLFDTQEAQAQTQFEQTEQEALTERQAEQAQYDTEEAQAQAQFEQSEQDKETERQAEQAKFDLRKRSYDESTEMLRQNYNELQSQLTERQAEQTEFDEAKANFDTETERLRQEFEQAEQETLTTRQTEQTQYDEEKALYDTETERLRQVYDTETERLKQVYDAETVRLTEERDVDIAERERLNEEDLVKRQATFDAETERLKAQHEADMVAAEAQFEATQDAAEAQYNQEQLDAARKEFEESEAIRLANHEEELKTFNEENDAEYERLKAKHDQLQEEAKKKHEDDIAENNRLYTEEKAIFDQNEQERIANQLAEDEAAFFAADEAEFLAADKAEFEANEAERLADYEEKRRIAKEEFDAQQEQNRIDREEEQAVVAKQILSLDELVQLPESEVNLDNPKWNLTDEQKEDVIAYLRHNQLVFDGAKTIIDNAESFLEDLDEGTLSQEESTDLNNLLDAYKNAYETVDVTALYQLHEMMNNKFTAAGAATKLIDDQYRESTERFEEEQTERLAEYDFVVAKKREINNLLAEYSSEMGTYATRNTHAQLLQLEADLAAFKDMLGDTEYHVQLKDEIDNAILRVQANIQNKINYEDMINRRTSTKQEVIGLDGIYYR